MKRKHLSKLALVAGILLAAGCGGSDSSGTGGSGTGGSGTGGTTTGSTGGASPSGSGGATGGHVGSGGALGTGGVVATGGSVGTGGSPATGGVVGTGGRAGAGGSATGAAGSRGATGGSPAGGTTGAAGRAGTGGTGGAFTGTCTASKSTGTNVSGTGPHKVVVETNSGTGINEGTIYRPMDLGGTEKYPIFVWGEGGCSLNGLSNSAAMGEIASHGYFVIADGTPNNGNSRSMNSGDVVSMGKPLLAYVTWAIAENDKPCSAYYQALDTTKVGANGFSCGGLMAEGTAGDPRITTWGLNSSGLLSSIPGFYQTVHTPVLIVLGGSSDIAYQNGEKDYTGIAAVGVPIMLFSKDLGHGGDLFSSHGGDFTKIDLAWLNWRLKGDETATGKGVLVGGSCTYCSNSAWEVKSMNVQ
ncbi:MAG TPA: hypothetical protein VHM31_02365 [Polyangia bacterium]|nr:hypothetical protein [Polyangia bacterium]